MSPEEAIEYALDDEYPAGAGSKPARIEPAPELRGATDEPSAVLTRREREVAALIEKGFTNRRIGGELSISEHTVANHVRNILKKLGLRSRAQISARL